MSRIPTIPTNIIVHLGTPTQSAENVTVPFIDYIKNVASSEIYSTWPQEALKANIYSQISFALNRVYTEWYPSKGYNFDITSSTQYDQKYIKDRNIYSNISVLVDEVFNNYLRKKGTVNPFFAQYCNGTTVTCEGLSQWGTVDLANQGLSAIEIIQNYYGDDVELVVNAPIEENYPSYPNTPLRVGDLGNDVRRMQLYLNRVGVNYPAIPKISSVDYGRFEENTENAVKEFQDIFNLPVTGIIDKATWYKIIYINTSVKKLAELDAEGVGYEDLPRQFSQPLSLGSTGGEVITLQFFLLFISEFIKEVPTLIVNGIYDEATKNSVEAFQSYAGIPVTGEINEQTWGLIYRAYKGLFDYVLKKENIVEAMTEPYPGVVLRQGKMGPSVKLLKTYLNYISKFVFEIPPLPIDSRFGQKTQVAVTAFQIIFDLEPTGVVDEKTWDEITDVYANLLATQARIVERYPGLVLEQEV